MYGEKVKWSPDCRTRLSAVTSLEPENTAALGGARSGAQVALKEPKLE